MRPSWIHPAPFLRASPAARGAMLLALGSLAIAPGIASAETLSTTDSNGTMVSDTSISDVFAESGPYFSRAEAVRALNGAISASVANRVSPAPGIDAGPSVAEDSASATCAESISVPGVFPGYRARLTMHYAGAKPTGQDGGGAGDSTGNVSVNVNGVQYSATTDPGSPPIPGAFTVEFDCDFDTINISYSIGAFMHSGCPSQVHNGITSSGSASGTLSRGTLVLLDPSGNPADFTANPLAGTIRAQSYPVGGSFSSFTVTNAAPTGLGSTMSLLDGTASAATQVNASFVAPPTDNSIKPVSDVTDLSGTNSDPVVIKIDFDPAKAQSLFGANYFNYLALAWSQNSTGIWKNAVLGNSGTTAPTFFNRGYNPATDFHLGYFGVDAANHYAWAVVNHNSQFVVTFPPPALAVRSVARPSAGLIRLACTGEPARANRIETSTNFQTWTTLATVTAAGDGTFTYDDSAASGQQKFYRVAYP